jgi:uncharacterized protein YcnI
LRRNASLALVAVLVVLPAAASAHVELKPRSAPAAGEKRLALVVENERADASTEGIDVQLPQLVTVVPRPPSGWAARVRGRRLVFEARRDSAKIAGEETLKRFAFTATLPDRPGTTLGFKVLQTYDDGEVVRWIGSAGSEEPAARLRLTAAKSAEEDSTTGKDGSAEPPAGQRSGGGEDDGGSALTIVLLIAIAAAAAGSVLWLRSRRRRS